MQRRVAVLTRRNELALILALLVIIAFFAVASPYFFTVRNLANVLGQASLAMIAGIGVAIVVAVELGRGISGANAGAIDVESQFRRMEEFVQELVPGRLLQLIDDVAGGI